MSTISLYLQSYQTKAQSRTVLQEFRFSVGEINDLNNRELSLEKGEDVTIEAENFLIWTSQELIPVSITTYSMSGNSLVANDPVIVEWQGVMSWPGKISISIENPSNNTSDQPYIFTAVYG